MRPLMKATTLGAGVALMAVGFVGMVQRGPAPAGVTVVEEGGTASARAHASMTATPTPTLMPLRMETLVAPTPASTPDATAVIEAHLPRTPLEVFLAALAMSTWPADEWARVEALVGDCENQTYDPTLVNHEDNGHTSVGYLQVNVDAHPGIAGRYDLTDPLQNLNAAREVQLAHDAAGLPSPWLYCDALIAGGAR